MNDIQDGYLQNRTMWVVEYSWALVDEIRKMLKKRLIFINMKAITELYYVQFGHQRNSGGKNYCRNIMFKSKPIINILKSNNKYNYFQSYCYKIDEYNIEGKPQSY